MNAGGKSLSVSSSSISKRADNGTTSSLVRDFNILARCSNSSSLSSSKPVAITVTIISSSKFSLIAIPRYVLISSPTS